MDRAGFSLLEMLVTLLVMSMVVVGILGFFDLSNRLSRTQVNIAEMQTIQRVAQEEVVRMVAMAGIGRLPLGIPPASALGLPGGVVPDGLALAVVNNAPADTKIAGDDDLVVLAGTDVLVVRGAFTVPVMFVEPEQALVLNSDGETSITLSSAVDVGVTQDLQPLRDALASGRPEALIVYDRYRPETFAVFELAPRLTSLGAAGATSMTIGLSLGSGATYSNEYGRMSLATELKQGAGGVSWRLPDGTDVTLPRDIGAIGLLEEYRFFVREEHEVPENQTSRIEPLLTRARLYPGTGDLHPEGAIALAENIVDLQVAIGIDSAPVDGDLRDDGGQTDEVLYNHPADDDGRGSLLASPWASPASRIFFTRISTVAQSDDADPSFPGAVLDLVEDHDYRNPASIFNTDPFYAKLRKRILETTVEMRNLP